VQVDPIKPKLKPPGTKQLKLKIDILLSTYAFKFNLRRYKVGPGCGRAPHGLRRRVPHEGRVLQVDPMKPKLKPPGTKRLKLKCDLSLSTSAFKINLRR
jgi:hypothetical protein